MYTIRKGKHHINFINSRALPEPYWAFVKEDRELAEIELGPGIFGIDHCTPYPDFIIACGLVDFTLYNITGIHRNGCPVFLTVQCVIFRGYPCDTDRCPRLLVRKVFHGFLKFRRFHKPV